MSMPQLNKTGGNLSNSALQALLYLRFINRNYRVLMPVCLSVCVSVCVHDNSRNNDSIHSDEFDIGHCPIKVKVTV